MFQLHKQNLGGGMCVLKPQGLYILLPFKDIWSMNVTFPSFLVKFFSFEESFSGLTLIEGGKVKTL